MATKRVTLTDARVRQAKPQHKPYSLYYTGGLYLTIAPTGAKWWRLKYRSAGKEKRMGLGAYPDVTRYRTRDRQASLSGITRPTISRCSCLRSTQRFSAASVACCAQLSGLAR